MTTLRPTKIDSLAAMQEAIATVRDHKGRILLGPSPKQRVQIDQWTAIDFLTNFAGKEGHPDKIYLTPAPKTPPPTRQEQWLNACNKAEEALETLQNLQSDANGWLQNMGHRATGATKQTLTQITYLQLARAAQTIDTAKQINFPKGFGRDTQ